MASDRRKLYTQFDTTRYLSARYTTVDETDARFFYRLRETFDQVPAGGSERRLIDIGCGPSVMVALLASSKYSEIHLCDFAAPSITAVEDWIEERPGCHDWGEYSKAIAEVENTSIKDVESRTRSRIKKVFECDMAAKTGLPQCETEYFDTVTLLESIGVACGSGAGLRTALGNIYSVLKPGGNIILSTTLERDVWREKNTVFPLYHLTLDELNKALADVGFGNISTEKHKVKNCTESKEISELNVAFSTAHRPL